jgi:hypothetical protein
MGCWEEEGRPFKMTDTVREWAPKFAEADHFGPLHIIVEDWNLEDDNIEYCRNLPQSGPADIALCEALQAMTWEERWAVAITSDDPTFDPRLLS